MDQILEYLDEQKYFVKGVYGDFWSQVDIAEFFYPHACCEFLALVWYNDLGDFWAYPVQVLVCAFHGRGHVNSLQFTFSNLGYIL